MLILSTRSYDYMAKEVRDCEDLTYFPYLGRVERKVFPDGELYQRIDHSLEGEDVVIIGGTISAEETEELYSLACAVVKYGASRLTLVIPYYGFSTMERAVRAGEVVTAKIRARLLSSIPSATNGNRVFMLDLHSEGIPHYFEGNVTTFHVYAKRVIIQGLSEWIHRVGKEKFSLGSTDAGRAKWVQSLANEIGVDPAFVLKKRDPSTGELSLAAVSAQVEGKDVAIYDDMIRTGGSLIQAARAYKDAGAERCYAIATHGVLPGKSLNLILDSDLFSGVVCTNSHPNAVRLGSTFVATSSNPKPIFRVLSVTNVLMNAIK